MSTSDNKEQLNLNKAQLEFPFDTWSMGYLCLISFAVYYDTFI